MKTQEGFALIELMTVVAVIGILAAIVILQYQNYVARSESISALATINPLKTTVRGSLSRGIAGNKTKAGTTAFTATRTYVGVAPGASKLGVVVVAIEDSGAGDISFTFRTGTSSSKNAIKAITLSHIADGVQTCESTQDKMLILKGCTK